MNLFFLHLPARSRDDEPGKNIRVTVQEPPQNTNEGSEFLDDAIRMKDQPLMYTNERVAATCLEGLL